MVWRIGDGQSVRIKEDKWLPVKPSRLILSPLPLVVAEARVSSLINSDMSMWKFEEVNWLFLPHEASLVLGIPFSHRKPSDRVSWSCTPSEEFNTSSAYKLLAAPTSTDRASSSNQDYQRSFWKGIWKLQIPNKIKHFIWRVCNNALPTNSNLKRRHIIDLDLCDLCKDALEDSLHALCFCCHIAPIWQPSNGFRP